MNFTYMKEFSDIKKLYEYCLEAEEFVYYKPNISATAARKAMEYVVKSIYNSVVGEDYGLTSFEMITDPRFIGYVNDSILINTIHYIRKMGNVAVHSGEISKEESIKILEELHFLVGEFCILIGLVEDYSIFEKPEEKSGFTVNITKALKQEEKQVEKVIVEPELIAKFAPRMRQTKFDVKHGRNEEENKKLYMSACLREAGWPIVNRKNQAMPGSAGIQMLLDDGDSVDYILYGRDNSPLAIVEYTTTSKNLIEGRNKAIDKANKLSIKLGYKPIVYYTNGYQIYVIDQLGYKPRRVFQFHTIEELELLKLRANIRKDISNPVIDDNITNRIYQKEAIKSACNAFMKKRRHSLLVMATGTGKTRVSISLVDVLMKNNWIKNVLFMADRTSLVRQAHKNFNKLLPSVTTSIYTGGNTPGNAKRDENARIIFSTYQTMINLINDDTREFGIGRFDLIVIDEAHRSIFKKYSSLFHYFDSLMLGLTATPRNEDNKSTYQMFEIPDGCPDYAYELEQAIDDGYLVGFNVLDRTTDALRRGIHYDELSDEEKASFEDTFATGDDYEETDLEGTVIYSSQLASSRRSGTKVINLGTIDAMLNDLMKNGLKVNNGDKIGKTIIFAKNHYEAEIIVERFQKIYSHLGVDFCKLVDCKVDNSLGLIDNFTERENMPQITVSVDMMDTGIDVPDVLNLVFFKTVTSKIKFLQMVGRGTRLSSDIFGPTVDKKGFLIFDYYDNFNYFRTRNTWSTVDDASAGFGINITPQTQLINRRKLGILRSLTEEKDVLTEFEEKYKKELKEFFYDTTRGLCNDDIEVQYNMGYVNKYRIAEQWDKFTDQKIEEIDKHILTLFPTETIPAKVKTFDLMIYVLEDEIPRRVLNGKNVRRIRHGFGNIGNKIDAMLEELSKLKTIPEIVKKEELIKQMRNADLLFENFSLEECERVRLELRDLMMYIPDDKRYYVINTKDYVIDKIEGSDESYETEEKSYAEKVQEYLVSENAILAKIRNLDELTTEEKQELENVFKSKLGTEADFAMISGNKELLVYLRVQVGISDEAIATKFGSFINENVLNSQQLTYINQIIDFAKENGDITFLDLQRVSPFCDIDIMSLFGDKIGYIKELINGLHHPVM